MALDTELEVRVVTWFRVDDSFYDHPKAEELPDSAVALWTRAGSWCSKHLTDGRIPYRKARKLCDNPDEAIPALLKSTLWEDDPSAGEYVFHDWSDPWNPSREQVLAERAKNAARQQAWRERRAAERQTTPAGATAETPPAAQDGALFPPPPTSEKAETGTRARSHKRLPADHRFDEFWEAYPHKRDKDQARRTWEKIVRRSEQPNSDVNLDEVIAGAAYYKLSREFANGTIKYPSTFLNAGSWRDYCNGPPPDHPASKSLVAIPGGLARPRGGFDEKFDEFARLAQEMRAEGGAAS